MSVPVSGEQHERFNVCAECNTEASRVAGRRRGSGYWWCWRCEKAIRPIKSETRR